ncbi:MAG TPA: decaprenyl-phosphate phosphoribosyltransferase [Gaiellaceae bacterium]|jgi:4-hydroxybenzoate polyprenyltransferase
MIEIASSYAFDELPRVRSHPYAALVAMRPRQWVKNLLLFAGLIFAAKIGDVTRLIEAVAAFVAYCSVSSAAYLVNDLRDVEADREHPTKRFRPIARGELPAASAITLVVLLSAVALAIGAVLGPVSLALILTFASVQGGYSFGLKHIPLLDVALISSLFVVRAVAGAVAVHVMISPWLLVCTWLLALFLALGKRRAEVVLVGARVTAGRRSIRRYTVAFVDQLIAAVGGAAVVSYAAYTVAGHNSRLLIITTPFVLFGIFRYVFLLQRQGMGEEPEKVLLGDRMVLTTVAVWAVVCAVILAAT